MHDSQRDKLHDVLNLLERSNHGECYETDSYSERCGNCNSCRIANAYKIMDDLTEPIHKGVKFDRTLGPSGGFEKLYYEEWNKFNERSPGRNNGYTALEHIIHEGDKPELATQHEALIAASVVQWFGTQCGREFIRNVTNKWKEQNENN